MRLITGDHCINYEVRDRFDDTLRGSLHDEIFADYVPHDFFKLKDDTWTECIYILYDHSLPVAVCKPTFERVPRIVSSFKPIVFQDERRKGYGTYMLAWIIREYLIKRNWNRLETHVWETNAGSMRMCSNLMVLEGILRKTVLLRGKLVNSHYFGLLREEIDDVMIEKISEILV